MLNALARIALVSLVALVLGGCATTAEEPSAGPVEEPVHEGVFVAHDADFSGYRRLLVTDLQLDSDVSVELGAPGFDPSGWGLSDADRRYYRSLYSELVVHYLVGEAGWGMSIDPDEDVLILVSEVRQSPPPPRSAEGGDSTGSLIINMELYDAQSNRLLAVITNRQPFGQSWQSNNRSVTRVQVQRAFERWVRMLQMELDDWVERY
ncbi:DUF3313 family protein [Marinimicrobium alkaliphilum]|uniref:DUF3313 family protein n=1 Tax=Marinimicrobium alkaliphilum TaxID=2202654 RepID=UPI000DB92494|nr:DUF3313 family protein [Marinimicrobium alkaliphilum]